MSKGRGWWGDTDGHTEAGRLGGKMGKGIPKKKTRTGPRKRYKFPPSDYERLLYRQQGLNAVNKTRDVRRQPKLREQDFADDRKTLGRKVTT